MDDRDAQRIGYEGKWVAWTGNKGHIVASGATAEDALSMAQSCGYVDVILDWVPPLNDSARPSPAPIDPEQFIKQFCAVLDHLGVEASRIQAKLAGAKNKIEDAPRPRDEVVHRGLTGRLIACVDDGVIFGRVLGITDVVTFQGDTVPEAIQAFRDSVDDYFDLCDRRASEQGMEDVKANGSVPWEQVKSDLGL